MTMSRRILDLARLQWLGRSDERRRLILVIGLIAIPLWQGIVWYQADELKNEHSNSATLGLSQDWRFVYFYHYLGYYPVTSEEPFTDHSVAGAQAHIAEHGDSLLMEHNIALRYGDLGQMYLFLPHVWLKGDCRNLSTVPANGIAFIIALMAAFAALWWLRLPIVAGALVLVIGSNPFQLFEVYRAQNVFSWPITTTLLMLALNAPMLDGGCKRTWFRWLVPVLSGMVLATIVQLRSEPALVVASLIAVYLTQEHESWRRRFGMVTVLVLTLLIAKNAFETYFDYKFESAKEMVIVAGGHPYPGPRDYNHRHWHPLFMGLDDFDSKYGYRWDDRHPALCAFPVLEERYGLEIPEYNVEQWRFDDFFLDSGKKYRVEPQQLPHYSEVIRAHVLSRIFSDPVWYVTIVAKRIWRVLTDTTPVRIGVGDRAVSVPFSGLLLLPIIALLCYHRKWLAARLACFGLATSIPAVVMFSGGGMCNYAVYHNILAALLFAGVVRLICSLKSGRSLGGAENTPINNDARANSADL